MFGFRGICRQKSLKLTISDNGRPDDDVFLTISSCNFEAPGVCRFPEGARRGVIAPEIHEELRHDQERKATCLETKKERKKFT